MDFNPEVEKPNIRITTATFYLQHSTPKIDLAASSKATCDIAEEYEEKVIRAK